jgi:hypothetical protein
MHRVSRFLSTVPFLAAALLSQPTALAGQDAATTGKINVIYEASSDEKLNEIAKIFEETKAFDEFAFAIGDSFRLPKDITMIFRTCDVPNASYSPARREITMCYELIAMIGENAAKTSQTEDEIGEKVLGAAAFFFFHELGHALVHQLDLPITGREEDAVDDLAALLALTGGDQGAMMLADTVEQFADMVVQKENEELRFWDEHSLDAQRMYHVLCLIYGSDPEKYKALVGDDMLPQQRAQRCPHEYKQRVRSWDRLLRDHLKPEGLLPSLNTTGSG